MLPSETRPKVWIKPEMTRIGKIGDVAGPNTGTTQNGSSTACSGSPGCNRS